MLISPRLALATTAALLAVAPAAHAADYTVDSATLNWTIANDSVSGGATRTFLG